MSYSEQMLSALKEEDLLAANLFFEEAQKKDAPEELEMLANELFYLGFLEEAKQLYELLLKRIPAELGFYIPLAEIAIENNENDLAFDYLERIPRTHVAYTQSLLVQADLYQVLGIPEVSEKKLLEAQEIMPDEELFVFALGELYFSTNQFVKALAAYQELLEDGSEAEFPVSLNARIGTIFTRLGAFEDAVSYLEAACQAEENDDLLFELGLTYAQLHENQKAIPIFEHLRILSPEYQSVYLPLAELLIEEELLTEAYDVLREGIKQNPYQTQLYYLASEVTYRLQNVSEAEDLLLQVLDSEEDELARVNLSHLYLKEERYSEAAAILEPILTEEDGNVFWNYATAQNGLENFSEAREYYQKALPKVAENPDFMKEFAFFLREDGEKQKAIGLLKHYLKHVPDDLEVLELLGEMENNE